MDSIPWAAGILEGEGCFTIFPRKNTNHKDMSIQCSMSDEDIIRRLYSVFNTGGVHSYQPPGVRVDGSPKKLLWRWQVGNHKGIKYVLTEVLPYLGERRTEKANELLEYIGC